LYNGVVNKNDDNEVLYHAGFPNAGEDLRAGGLNLDSLIVRRRASTFFWKLASDVPELQWPTGTLVVVDRSQPAHHDGLVVAIIDEDFVLCRYRKDGFRLLNGEKVTAGQLWGKVTYAVVEPQ
jgi:SOS-response transcriptional repressor LexA